MSTGRLAPEQLEKILRELDDTLAQAQALRDQIVRAMAGHRHSDQQNRAGQPERRKRSRRAPGKHR